IGLTLLLISQISLQPFSLNALYFLFACLFIANLFAATQDIAVDGLGVESLTLYERGTANGLQVAMYRMGGITGGGLTMLMLSWISWQAAFIFLAMLALLTCIPIYRHPEPKTLPVHARTQSFRQIYAGFFNRPGMLAWLAVLLLFRAGHSFGTSMEKPFLVDNGLTLADIGLLSGIFGLVASVIGAIFGGFMINQFGRLRMLTCFILLQTFALCLYSYLGDGLGRQWLYVIPVFEHAVGGMATAALFTVAMDVSRREHAGSDYTIQASLALLITGLFQLGSGFSAHYLGYSNHFKLAALLALLTLIPVYLWSRTREKYDVE
ncbi:MAG TPA: MFS transporter, partial [Pseudomonadales bacterium]|nr:MFS transporter [Pseudomonadales bacterium]